MIINNPGASPETPPVGVSPFGRGISVPANQRFSVVLDEIADIFDPVT